MGRMRRHLSLGARFLGSGAILWGLFAFAFFFDLGSALPATASFFCAGAHTYSVKTSCATPPDDCYAYTGITASSVLENINVQDQTTAGDLTIWAGSPTSGGTLLFTNYATPANVDLFLTVTADLVIKQHGTDMMQTFLTYIPPGEMENCATVTSVLPYQSHTEQNDWIEGTLIVIAFLAFLDFFRRLFAKPRR